MIADYADKKKAANQQMRPIARNLKAPAPPRFRQEHESENDMSLKYTYSSNAITFNSVHQVRVVHLEKGINLFYVQLIALDSQLQALNAKIQTINLRPLKERPSELGTACLAKYHKKVYRVAIGRASGDARNSDLFLCHFVDFGFSNMIKFDSLFYIPYEIIDINTFAISFCFSGLKNCAFKANMIEVNYLFRHLTENKLVTLKCVPPTGKEFVKMF